MNERHRFLALGAPLSITSTGQFDEPVNFNGTTFAAGTDIAARYRFNSYRLTWRYGVDPTGDFRWGLGLTGKIRDAEIKLAGGGVESSKTNVGFVPLINFNLEARLTDAWWLTVEGDALAAPQGRAEDVFAGIRRDFDEQSSIRLGYRLLEGARITTRCTTSRGSTTWWDRSRYGSRLRGIRLARRPSAPAAPAS